MSYIDELIELNNIKRKQLTPENLKMYEKVLVYLRTEWKLSNRHTEEVLNDLLDHLLESQRNGVTTEEFFGDNPETFAKDLVEELPEENKRSLMSFVSSLFLISLGFLVFAYGFSNMIISFFHKPQVSENLIGFVTGYLIGFMLFLLFLNYLLKAIQKDEFQPEKNWFNKVMNFLFLWFICAIIFAAFILPMVLIKVGPSIFIPWYIAMPIGVIIILFGRYALNRYNEE
ncbi:DUF1129 family protein [Macrococcus lamae]|uniref:DUF1129 family protein n=1 Tax=Macrococcus lamae TaxID=198484 RepID=A0A4R6BV75_9STAP|nr:DUF1129 family protein [Macrococcus lamae]TDM12238.1 DUF1129 family protein [Macrococcus lamae]